MKTFEILNLELENIKTYKYESIDFSQGNNVLIGENGAGKSTILESIYLALFGETVPGRTIADMVRFGEKQGKITIRFTIDDHEFRIVDELVKKDENHASQRQKLINETLEETIAEGKNAVKAKMEEMLNIDATTFSSAVYASQGEIGKIVTAKDKERKTLFDRLFQIERFEKAWTNLAKVEKLVKSEIKNLEKDILNMKDNLKDLPKIAAQIKERTTELKNEKTKLADIRITYSELDQKYKVLEKFITQYNQFIGIKKTVEVDIAQLTKTIETIHQSLCKKDTIETLERKLPAVSKLKEKIDGDISKISNSLESLEEKENQIKINLEKINSLKRSVRSSLGTASEYQNELNEDINDFADKIPELSKNIDDWSESIPKIRDTNKEELAKLVKEKKNFDKLLEKKSREEFELSKLKESSDKYHSKTFKKRLILSKEAGDNWQEIINEYSTIDFEKKITKVATQLDKKEEEQTEQLKRKSVIDDGLLRIKSDLEHIDGLSGNETCPTCKQNLSDETLKQLVETLNMEKSDFIEEKKQIKQRIKEFDAKIIELKNQEKELSSKSQLFIKIKPTYDDLVELESDKDKVEKELKKKENEFNKLKAQFSQEKVDELEESIESLEIIFQDLKQANELLPKLIRKRKNLTSELAETKKLKKEINELEVKSNEKILDELSDKIRKLEVEKDSLQIIYDELKQLVTSMEALNDENEKLKTNAEAISEIKKQEGFKDQAEMKEKHRTLGETISSKKTNIKNLKEDIIPPLVERQESLLKNETDLHKKEIILTLENKKKEITSILRGLMRELPNRLLPNFIERINTTATEILQSIIPGSDIQNIVLNDDYSLQIIRLGNYENISVLSGGETVIIALALRLAFAKEFSALDSLILDEPTIFLDERRRGELVTVLERNRLVRQMFVVTHDHDFERISDKTYFITKIAGETRVEQMDSKEDNEISLEDVNLS